MYKKILAICLAAIVSMLAASAQYFYYQGVKYYHSGVNECNVVKGSSPSLSGNLEIPQFAVDTESSYGSTSASRVVSIAPMSFENFTELTSVKLPPTVREVGGSAFGECTSLETIELPANLEYFGVYAFENCTSLRSINIPGHMSVLGNGTFNGCTALRKVIYDTDNPLETDAEIFDESVYRTALLMMPEEGLKKAMSMKPWRKFVNRCVYSSTPANVGTTFTWDGLKYKVTSVQKKEVCIIGGTDEPGRYCYLPEQVMYNGENFTVTAIGDRAFADRSQISKVRIPGTVRSFGQEVWKGCRNIMGVTYCTAAPPCAPDNLFDNVVYRCALLTLDCPLEDVEDITPWCRFTSRDFPTVVNLLYSVTSPTTARVDGADLTEPCHVVISEKIMDTRTGNYYDVTEIAAGAFARNINIRSVNIPASITKLGQDAFYGCENLTKIYYNAPALQTYENTGYFGGCGTDKDIIIGENVEYLGPGLFQWTCISEINIPDNVQVIDKNCFNGIINLWNVSLGKGLKAIYDGAFAWTTDRWMFIHVHFSDLEEYNGSPFAGQRIAALMFHEEVESISPNVFNDCNPNYIYCYSTIPPEVGVGALGKVDPEVTGLYVPEGAMEGYSAHLFWGQFLTCMIVLTALKRCGKMAHLSAPGVLTIRSVMMYTT